MLLSVKPTKRQCPFICQRDRFDRLENNSITGRTNEAQIDVTYKNLADSLLIMWISGLSAVSVLRALYLIFMQLLNYRNF